MSRLSIRLGVLCCLVVGCGILIHYWNHSFSKESILVVYFQRPSDSVAYVRQYGHLLAKECLYCFATACGSLLLAGVLSTVLLAVGLLVRDGLTLIERMAAFSQTIPVLIVVFISLLLERSVSDALGANPHPDLLCVLPVTISLIFPPLVNGASAITRMPIQMKALLRIWDAPTLWRIWRVYLPYSAFDILTGVRASASWAVGAVLIAEGLVNGTSKDSDTLGHSMIRPFSSGMPGQTPVVLLSAVLLGYSVYYFFSLLQDRIERRIYGRVKAANDSYPLQNGLRFAGRKGW